MERKSFSSRELLDLKRACPERKVDVKLKREKTEKKNI